MTRTKRSHNKIKNTQRHEIKWLNKGGFFFLKIGSLCEAKLLVWQNYLNGITNLQKLNKIIKWLLT